MNFDTLIESLKASPAVDGLMLIGSASQDTLNAHSDRDLLIVLEERPIPISYATIYCAGILVELIIETRERIENLIASEPGSISLSDSAASFFRWVPSGTVILDRSGCLERLRGRIAHNEICPTLSEGESLSRADKAHYNLAQTRRMSNSPDPLYQRAVDLRMLYQLADLMVDYFNLRGMAWAGEKESIRYWQANDPAYLELFTACYWEPDRGERVRLYGELVRVTIEPAGFYWDGDGPMFRLSPSSMMTREHLLEAREFWKSLVSEGHKESTANRFAVD
ncbi:MAG: hypothetical protein F4Y49_07395 [Dehalococcoidia bacterium]|nr:hypothetical protein [Dehalococcoidia bacterium]